MRNIFLCLLSSLACVACTKQQQHITPMYQYLEDFRYMKAEQRDSLMRADSAEIAAFFKIVRWGAVCDSTLCDWSISPATLIFTPPTDSVYPSVEPLEQTLSQILSNAKKQGLDLPKRRYVAVVWQELKPIIFIDDCMMIALNHYIGADYEGYSRWAEYQRAGKTPQRLPYDIAEALVGTYRPYAYDENATALNRMVYEGVLTLAKLRLVPDADLAEALGYTPDQLKWLKSHEKEVWRTLIQKDLLYDASDLTIERLVSPAPFTTLLTPDSPGRAGRYVGYRIVESYLCSHSGKRLSDLLTPEFYNAEDILVVSGYSPE